MDNRKFRKRAAPARRSTMKASTIDAQYRSHLVRAATIQTELAALYNELGSGEYNLEEIHAILLAAGLPAPYASVSAMLQLVSARRNSQVATATAGPALDQETPEDRGDRVRQSHTAPDRKFF